jgi:adenine deaminase
VHKSVDSKAKSRYELARVALGEIDADLAVVNGRMVNVYTGEVLDKYTVLIKGDKIAYAGKNPRGGVGPDTQVYDAGGKVLIPGFIDGHTHTDYIYSSHELVKYALKTGTTCIITDVAELTFALGYKGLREFLKSVRDQPVKYYITIPPMVTISPVARKHTLDLEQVKRLLKERDILGIGEVYWGPLLAGDIHLLDLISESLEAGKKIEGHGAGASAGKLQAYAALGVTSDHEPITPEEALERLRLGMSVMIREGEIRRDLAAVSKIKDRNIDFRRLAVSTDGIGPIQLTTRGFMDCLVQESIDLGFSPMQAVRMATLNVAEHFGLEDSVGGIAPGRFADIVVIPDLDTIRPELVISNGRIVADNGELLVQSRRHVYSSFTYGSIHLGREFAPHDFKVPVDTEKPKVKVRVIDQLTNLLTREALLDLQVTKGEILMDGANDIVKVAAVERRHEPGKTFTAFIRGLGLNAGAVATSTCWDSSDIVVVGANETDMALAVNRINELGGGLVACSSGEVLAELAFPVGGMISTEPMEVLARKLTRVQEAGRKMGCTSPDIRTTVSVLTTGAIPHLRICESGLFDIRSNCLVDLIIA